MELSRRRPKGVVSFGLSLLTLFLMPSAIGHQDLVAQVTRSLELSRARDYAISTFRTIHEANFKLPQPVGTIIPQPLTFTLASLDQRDIDSTTGSVRGQERLGFPALRELDFPKVQRRLKGDMLAPLPPEQEGPVAVRRLKGDMLVARPRPTPEPDEKIEREARPVVRLPPEPELAPEPPAVLAARPPVTEKPPAVEPPNPLETSVWPPLEQPKQAEKEPA